MKIFIICATIIGLAASDKLPSQRAPAPYAPTGWKPSGPQLGLPSEYGPPAEPAIQLTQEQIRFAGQQSREASNEYLPPAPADAQDVLRVQGLPVASPSNFNGRLNAGEIQTLQQLQASRQEQQQRYSNQIRFEQLKYQYQQQQQQRIQQQQVNGQYGAPAKQQQPEAQYGPPQQQAAFPPNNQYGPPEQNANPTELPEENFDDSTETEEIEGGAAVAVANSINNGQYYILGEDNTLQRVVYMTSQTETDRRNKGFTARLQYAPVEPIRDPIYAYDALGQLVRIYNRK